MSQTKNHQGVIGFVSAHQYVGIHDIIEIAKQRRRAFIIILDGITDPHNLGAIRTADASGAHGVIIPKRRRRLNCNGFKNVSRSNRICPVAKAVNLSSAIEELKKKGYGSPART